MVGSLKKALVARRLAPLPFVVRFGVGYFFLGGVVVGGAGDRIVKEEGAMKLYSGFTPIVVRLPPSLPHRELSLTTHAVRAWPMQVRKVIWCTLFFVTYLPTHLLLASCSSPLITLSDCCTLWRSEITGIYHMFPIYSTLRHRCTI